MPSNILSLSSYYVKLKIIDLDEIQLKQRISVVLKLYYGIEINSKIDILLLKKEFAVLRIDYADRMQILSCLSMEFEVLQQSAFLPSIRG